jgi:hypothetical protein
MGEARHRQTHKPPNAVALTNRAAREARLNAMQREGQGVYTLGVYTLADLAALTARAGAGDAEAISDQNVIGGILRDFEACGRGCFFCGGPVSRVSAVITITASVHQPATAAGGVVCPDCCSGHEEMRSRIEADWRKWDVSLRKIDISSNGGRA